MIKTDLLIKFKSLFPFLFISLVIVLVDQCTKYFAVKKLIINESYYLISDWLAFKLVYNSGAAFSVAATKTPLLVLLSILIIIVVFGLLIKSRQVSWKISLALILGGAVGNLIDRFTRGTDIFHGKVVDFIAVGWWPVFNIADSCITLAVIVISGLVLLGISIK